jgi:hypothetical protein
MSRGALGRRVGLTPAQPDGLADPGARPADGELDCIDSALKLDIHFH